jgi:hypothetical protein
MNSRLEERLIVIANDPFGPKGGGQRTGSEMNHIKTGIGHTGYPGGRAGFHVFDGSPDILELKSSIQFRFVDPPGNGRAGDILLRRAVPAHSKTRIF